MENIQLLTQRIPKILNTSVVTVDVKLTSDIDFASVCARMYLCELAILTWMGDT